MATSIKISQLPAKGANLEATDLLEVSEFNGTGYVSKSITGQEIIDSASGGSGVTDVTATAPIVSTGGTTPDISMAVADAGHDGYLSSTDWNTFDAKVDSVTATYPMFSTGGANPDLSMYEADGTVPGYISTADYVYFANKQQALVSGTNIKTINGSSLLGSGNLTISGGGGGIHALVKPQTGDTVTVNINATAPSVITVINNRLFTFAFIPAQSITCSALYINCATAQAGALARILIYSDLNGLPNTKLYESSNLDLSSNGVKTATTSFTFNAGTTYWLALHTSGTTALVSSHALAAFIPVRTTGLQINTYYYPTSNPVFGSAPSPFGAATAANTAIPFIGITSI